MFPSSASPAMRLPAEKSTGNPATLRLLQIGAEWQSEVPGGVNRYTYGLAQAFAERGIPQHWVVVGKQPVSPGPTCHVIPAAPAQQRLPGRLRALGQAARALESQSDLVTSHFSLYGFAARRSLRKLPHVLHFHGPWADESAVEGGSRWAVGAKRMVERRVYRSAVRCITLSQAFAEILASRYGIDRERIRVVPGGIALEEWDGEESRSTARERLGWPTDRPLVLCIRRLARRMGLENLIDATAQLVRQHPELLVMVGGKGPLQPQLQQQVEQLGLQNHVRLLGFVPDDELPLAYRAADLSIVPTQALEGFGLITLESLASGTPVLVTPVGGLPEAVAGLTDQLVLPGVSTQSIYEGLHAALTGTVALPSAEACRQYVAQNFAWSHIAQRVLSVYSEAL